MGASLIREVVYSDLSNIGWLLVLRSLPITTITTAVALRGGMPWSVASTVKIYLKEKKRRVICYVLLCIDYFEAMRGYVNKSRIHEGAQNNLLIFHNGEVDRKDNDKQMLLLY